jgi:catechol 2,3-dioxygenase-like lactoylglutathione lyase family enzyme
MMDWKLELVVVPVADVDRAKAFYTDNAGFTLDVDYSAGESFRVVQLTPPGSACSIALMRNPDAAGSLSGLTLVVNDIDAARAELVGRGVDATEPYHHDAGGEVPGPDPDRRDYATFVSFKDPDGNTWLVQEVKRTGKTDPSTVIGYGPTCGRRCPRCGAAPRPFATISCRGRGGTQRRRNRAGPEPGRAFRDRSRPGTLPSRQAMRRRPDAAWRRRPPPPRCPR